MNENSVFFFFQAEDGIRDIGVTGVQTCALPIFLDASGLHLAIPPASAKYPVRVARPSRTCAGPVGCNPCGPATVLAGRDRIGQTQATERGRVDILVNGRAGRPPV